MFEPFHAELRGIRRLYGHIALGTSEFTCKRSRRNGDGVDKFGRIVARLVAGTDTEYNSIARSDPADGIGHERSRGGNRHGIAINGVKLVVAALAARVIVGHPLLRERFVTLDDVGLDRIVADGKQARVGNKDYCIRLDRMVHLVGVHALAPEYAQPVVAVEARHSREKRIFHVVEARRHHGSDRISCIETLVALHNGAAFPVRGITHGIPGGNAHRVIRARLESLDFQAETVQRIDIKIKALAVDNRKAQVVFLLVGMRYGIEPHGIVVRAHPGMAQVVRTAGRIYTFGAQERNLQVTDVLVFVRRPDDHVVTDNHARKLRRLVEVRLVGGAEPFDKRTRSPGRRLHHVHTRRRQVVAEMQEHSLYGTGVAFGVLAVERHLQAVVGLNIILHQFGQVQRIVRLGNLLAILDGLGRLVYLLRRNRLRGVVNHGRIEPHANIGKIFPVYGQAEHHPIAGGSIVLVGAPLEHVQFHYLAVKKELGPFLFVGARYRKNTERNQQKQAQEKSFHHEQFSKKKIFFHSNMYATSQ